MVHGRKGEESLILEVLISIAFFTLFGVTAFLYIASNANSEAFFAKVYATEVATMAELVNAPQGDVTLTYDNLREDLAYRFEMTASRIVVSPIREEGIGPSETRFYGMADEYVRESVLDDPSYLVLRKVGGSFGILDAQRSFGACTHPGTRLVPLHEASVWFTADGLSDEELQEVEDELFRTLNEFKIPIASDEATATVLITLHVQSGSSDVLATQQTSEDGAAIACLFEQSLEALSLREFSGTQPPTSLQSRIELEMTLTIDNTGIFDPEYIGQGLGHALGRYY